MAWPLAGIAAAALPMLGSALDFKAAREQNRSQETMAKDAMGFSAAQTAQQQEFQERMSSSAHQREVADLKAAGLNPILSANGGASSPTGSSASGVVGSTVPASLGKLATSAMEGMRWKQERDLMSNQVKSVGTDVRVKEEQGENLYETRRGLRLENDLLQKRNDFFSKHPWAFKLNAAAGGVNSASGMLRLLK